MYTLGSHTQIINKILKRKKKGVASIFNMLIAQKYETKAVIIF